MIISVASGKGGTGKTTVATGIAKSLGSCQFFDFDVEAPNAGLFLKPEIRHIQQVTIKQPVFLTGSGESFEECARFCHYNAVAVTGDEVIFFPELCHGCGGCVLVGPQGAVREDDVVVGEIRKGIASPDIEFFMGDLKPGSMRTTTIQGSLEKYIDNDRFVLVDCPPGTSCSMVTSIRNSDYCLLITEPTPFGLNDLLLSVEVVKKLDIPFGVIVNREGIGDEEVSNYCRENNIRQHLKIPNDIEIARIISRGDSFVDYYPAIKDGLIETVDEIKEVLGKNS